MDGPLTGKWCQDEIVEETALQERLMALHGVVEQL